MVPAHSDRVHDKLAPMVIAWGTVGDVVRVVLRPKVMTQFMGCHQICFLVVVVGGGDNLNVWKLYIDLQQFNNTDIII